MRPLLDFMTVTVVFGVGAAFGAGMMLYWLSL